MAEDYYKVLGVNKSASKDEIKKAYKKLAMKHHPDRNKGDKKSEEIFKKINEAYAVLSDENKRKQYDQFGAEGFSNRFSTEDIFRGFDFGSILKEFGLGDDIFSSIFGGGGPGAGGRRRPGRSSPFSFEFGGDGGPEGQPGFGQAPRRPVNLDLETELSVTLQEAVYGSKKSIAVNMPSGTQRILVTIPPGIDSGKKLKVRGKGQKDNGSGRVGDLYCKISIQPHPAFTKEGRNLVVEKEVKLTDLVLGGAVKVETLDGKTLELQIPPLSKNNATLRVRGKGLPEIGKSSAGNLLVKLSASLPAELSDEQKELFEKLSDSGI
jgi:curved DNA-binding protein